MSLNSLIRTDVIGGLGVITLNRPQALNALTLEMVRELTTVLRGWAHDAAVHAVLLHGSARPPKDGQHPTVHFCAGGDIRFMHDAALAGDLALDDTLGQLLKGEDSFTVGGTLDVGVRQEAGKYTGSFTVAVEYQ